MHVICTEIFANRLKVNPQSLTVHVSYYVGFNQFENNPTKDNKKRDFFLFLNLDFPCFVCFFVMTGENKVLIILFVLSLPFLYYRASSYVLAKCDSLFYIIRDRVQPPCVIHPLPF